MKNLENKAGLRRLVACALVFAMMLTLMPTAAFAKQAAPFGWWLRSVRQQPAAAIARELKVGDLTVSVEAEAGAFPAGTEVKAEKAEHADVQKAVDEAADVDGTVLYAVDITFTKDGAELQPAEGKTVKVSFAAEDLKEVAEDAAVVHIDAETEKAEKIDTVEAEAEDTVAFEAEKFSVYAVVGTPQDENRRVKIVFMNGETEIDTVYLKEADLGDPEDPENAPDFTEKIIYDPGVPDAGDTLFLGWTQKQDYTEDDIGTGIDIEEIRDLARAAVRDGVEEGETLTFYAMLFSAYRVYFEDEQGIVFETDTYYFPRGEAGSKVVSVNQPYTVTDSTLGFIGWQQLDGEGNPVGTPLKNGSVVTITGDTTFRAVTGTGHWLSFDENDAGTGGSFTPPVFYAAGEDTVRPAADPTRPGYTFVAWHVGPRPEPYSSTPTGEVYNFNERLEEDLVLYAEWEPKTDAKYKVIIWEQKVTDDKDATKKTYDYVESEVIQNVTPGTEITDAMVAPYTTRDYSYDSYHGDVKNTKFEYSHYEIVNGVGSDGRGVAGDDSTVVNVYYDRSLFKVVFEGYGDQKVFSPSDRELSTMYGLVDGNYVLLDCEVEKSIVWYKSKGGAQNEYGPQRLGNLETVYYKGENASEGWFSISTSSLDLSTAELEGIYSYINLSNFRLEKSSDSGQQMFRSNGGTGSDYYAVARIKGGDVSYSYNGEPYTGQRYEEVDGTVYTGLYGQSFAMYDGYKWELPSPSSQWNHVSYLDAFSGNLFGGKNLGPSEYEGEKNSIYLREIANEPNTNVIYWQQDPEDETVYTVVGTTRYYFPSERTQYNITERFEGVVSAGYRYSESGELPTSWSTAYTDNHLTEERVGDNDYLHIKYDLVKSDIIFLYGSDPVKTIEDVPYGRNLSRYQDDIPTQDETGTIPDGYYFAGWFEDPEGLEPADFSKTMPPANKTYYGLIAPKEYHFHADLSDGTTLPNDQWNSFVVPYRTKIEGINFMNANPPAGMSNVSLVGWFLTDENGNIDYSRPYNFDLIQITDNEVTVSYEDHPEARDDYFDEHDTNHEYTDVDDPAVQGVVVIKPAWRNNAILESGGIHIRYQYEGKNGTESFEDPLTYADLAEVFAQRAPDEDDVQTGKHFKYWQLATDESVEFYPSQTFRVTEPGEGGTAIHAVDENGTLYVTFVAVLDDDEQKTETHIYWYPNTKDMAGNAITAALSYKAPAAQDDELGVVVKDEDLWINANVRIPAFDTYTYEGYIFRGWNRVETGHDPTADLFLKWENDKYYAQIGNDWVEVTDVAADEKQPYHDLYAVWEKIPTFKVVYASDATQDAQSGKPTVSSDKIYEFRVDDFKKSANDATKPYLDVVYGVANATTVDGQTGKLKNVYDECLYGGYIFAEIDGNGVLTLNAYGNKENGDASGDKIVPQENMVYYVKDVDPNYLAPYYKYTYVKKEHLVTGLWSISILDDLNYASAGFIAWNIKYTAQDGGQVEYNDGKPTDFPIENAYTTLTVKTYHNKVDAQGNPIEAASVTVTPTDLYDKAGASSRLMYVGIEAIYGGDFLNEIRANRCTATFSAIPFWVTFDGIPVLAKKYRTITVHPSKTVNTKAVQSTLTRDDNENSLFNRLRKAVPLDD